MPCHGQAKVPRGPRVGSAHGFLVLLGYVVEMGAKQSWVMIVSHWWKPHRFRRTVSWFLFSGRENEVR